MDAIELLIQDHNKVKGLFQQIEAGAKAKQAAELFNQIYHELSVHTIIEEQVFYPAIAKYPDFAGLLKDAYKEHAEAKLELGDISNLDSTSEEWHKKVTKLQKDIEHHVKDEEEKLFPKLRQTMPAPELQELGKELKQAKTANLDGALLSQPHSVHASA